MTASSDAPTTAGHRRASVDALVALGAVVVLAAGGIVLFAALGSASGRISASTENTSNLFEAGQVDLRLDTSENLLFDADGLYPGLELERCVPISYVGSIGEVDIRLTGRRESDTAGLEQFVQTSIMLGRGSDPDCSDYVADRVLYEGALSGLWSAYSSFENGLKLGSDVQEGFETTIRVTAAVDDDDEAQGLTTEFWVTLEARP